MFHKRTATTSKNAADSSGMKASRPSSSSGTGAPPSAVRPSSSYGDCGCDCGCGYGGQNVNYEPPLSLKKHGFRVLVFKPRERRKTSKNTGGQALPRL
ncbi:hypothetical protein LA080_008874 [Diaporthe eres]|nr:hypothetical protein LA080_008874 [Diaporthe eres]